MRILFICLMIVHVSRAVTVQEIYNLEGDIVSASLIDNIPLIAQIPVFTRLFLAKRNLFFDMTSIAKQQDEYFIYDPSNNHIRSDSHIFQLTDLETHQLIDLMRMAARGRINPRSKPLVLTQNEKICVIDVQHENGDYYFNVYVFDKKQISRELSAKITGIKNMLLGDEKNAKINALIKGLKYSVSYRAQEYELRPDPAKQGHFLFEEHALTISVPEESLFNLLELREYHNVYPSSDNPNYQHRATITFDGEKFHLLVVDIPSNADGLFGEEDDDMTIEQGITHLHAQAQAADPNSDEQRRLVTELNNALVAWHRSYTIPELISQNIDRLRDGINLSQIPTASRKR